VSVPPIRHLFYLHGFASSARSTKAAYIAERLRGRDVTLHTPDFNEPDFRTLTMTRMLDRVAAECDVLDGPVALIGSSLGGAVAILAANRLPAAVDRLILLAPAVMFAKPGHHLLPPERIEEWRRRGAMPFFHYGAGAEKLLDYAFYEDAADYDPFATAFSQPTLIFQGRNDASVDPGTVEAFSRVRPNVTLSLLDDDHQLLTSLPAIWRETERFLGLAA
jgi:pimeloyl-ACP methyl ester carboxylesterase